MPGTDIRKSQDSGDEKNPAALHVEKGDGGSNPHGLDLYAIRQNYPLLADASEEKLEELNKAVLRKLDWVFLPVITLMLLMK
jgi:hypothetical protein